MKFLGEKNTQAAITKINQTDILLKPEIFSSIDFKNMPKLL